MQCFECLRRPIRPREERADVFGNLLDGASQRATLGGDPGSDDSLHEVFLEIGRDRRHGVSRLGCTRCLRGAVPDSRQAEPHPLTAGRLSSEPRIGFSPPRGTRPQGPSRAAPIERDPPRDPTPTPLGFRW